MSQRTVTDCDACPATDIGALSEIAIGMVAARPLRHVCRSCRAALFEDTARWLNPEATRWLTEAIDARKTRQGEYDPT